MDRAIPKRHDPNVPVKGLPLNEVALPFSASSCRDRHHAVWTPVAGIPRAGNRDWNERLLALHPEWPDASPSELPRGIGDGGVAG